MKFYKIRADSHVGVSEKSDPNSKEIPVKKSVLLSVAAAMLTGVVFAQDHVTPNLDMGTKTIEGSGSLDTDTPVGTQFDLQLAYGYFIMDNLELAALGGIQDNDDFTTYEFGGRAEYNILTDTPLVPFIGAGILWAGADADKGDDEDTVVARFSAGVKYFIDDNVALALSVVYDKAGDDIFIDEDGDADDDNIKGLFGVRFYFD